MMKLSTPTPPNLEALVGLTDEVRREGAPQAAGAAVAGVLGLRMALHEGHALALVLEAREVAPAAVLALVLRGRARNGVVNGDVPDDDRGKGCGGVRWTDQGKLTRGDHGGFVLFRSVVVFDEDEQVRTSKEVGDIDAYRRSIPGHVEAGNRARYHITRSNDPDFSRRALARRPAVGIDVRGRAEVRREGPYDEVLTERLAAWVVRRTSARDEQQHRQACRYGCERPSPHGATL